MIPFIIEIFRFVFRSAFCLDYSRAAMPTPCFIGLEFHFLIFASCDYQLIQDIVIILRHHQRSNPASMKKEWHAAILMIVISSDYAPISLS